MPIYKDQAGRTVTADEALIDGRTLRSGYRSIVPARMMDAAPAAAQHVTVTDQDIAAAYHDMVDHLVNAYRRPPAAKARKAELDAELIDALDTPEAAYDRMVADLHSAYKRRA